MLPESDLHKRIMDGAFIPALPLALDSSLELDICRQRALVRYYLDAGVDGIAAAVHTTQFEIREHPHTYHRLLEIVSAEIDAFQTRSQRRIIKVAGICGTRSQALTETSLVTELGYDAGLVSVAAYPHETAEDELVEHCRAISDCIPVFGFYLQPAVGGRVLPYSFWAKLVTHPNVVAIKAAPFNRYYTNEVARAIAETDSHLNTALYTGNDDCIIFDLLSTFRFPVNGGLRSVPVRGGLLGHWSVWTQTAVKLFHAAREARDQESIPQELLRTATEVTDANSAFFDAAGSFKGCIAGIHEVLRRQGFFDGIYCYPGNERLSDGQIEEIERVYRSYPHLNDDQFVATHLHEWLRQ